MKYKLIIVGLCFICAQTLCAEELKSEDKLSLAKLDANYKNDLIKIQNSYAEQITKLDELYSNYLEQILDGFKKTGDLDKSLAAKEEIKRFGESKSMPDKLSEIPDIKKLQEVYRTQEAAYKLSSSKQIVEVVGKLSSQYDQLQIELVKSDRLEDALLAKNRYAAILASQDYSGAKKIADAGVAVANKQNIDDDTQKKSTPPRDGVLHVQNEMQESGLSGAINLQYQNGQLRFILDKKYESNWIDLTKIDGKTKSTGVSVGKSHSVQLLYFNDKLGSNNNWLDIRQIDDQLREIEVIGRGLPAQKLQYQEGKLRVSMRGRNGDWIVIKKLAANEPAIGKPEAPKEEDRIPNDGNENHTAKLTGSWKRKGDNTIFTFDGKDQGYTNTGTKFTVYYDNQLKHYVVKSNGWTNYIWLSKDSKTLTGQDISAKNYFYFDKI